VLRFVRIIVYESIKLSACRITLIFKCHFLYPCWSVFVVYFIHINCIRCGVWCQDVLHERVKLHKTWKDTEALLEKKKDEKTKLEEQQRTDRLAVVTREVSEV